MDGWREGGRKGGRERWSEGRREGGGGGQEREQPVVSNGEPSMNDGLTDLPREH